MITLIGILSSLAAPRINLDQHRVDSAARSLGLQLLTAQRAAVKSQHNVVVSFDVAEQRLRIHDDANNNGAIESGERVEYAELGEGVVFGRGAAPPHPLLGRSAVSFTRTQAGLPAVTFHRNGSAREEGGLYITSRRAATTESYSAETRALVITRATGRTSWFRFSSSWEQEF